MPTIHTTMLDLPFTISPSTSFLSLLLKEEGKEEGLEFVALFNETQKYAVVRFQFKRLIGGKMSCLWGVDLDGIGLISDSLWLKEINDLQKESYPQSCDDFKDLKHYYFTGHDVRVEILAEDFSWSKIRDLDW